MEPPGSPHLAAGSRYDLHPPPPHHQLGDPSFYPWRSHHHPSFPAAPPLPPYENQHPPPYLRDRYLLPPMDDGSRLCFPQPRPDDPFHHHPLRVPDHFTPTGDFYPSPRPHLLGHGEGFVQEPRESRLFFADRFGTVDESQDLLRLRWKVEERRMLAASGGVNFQREDLDTDMLRRKKTLWVQDPDFDENLGVPRKRPLRLSDRVIEHQHHGLPELLHNASLGPVYATSPRDAVAEWRKLSPATSSYSDRDREREIDGGRGENGSITERPLQSPVPTMRPGHCFSGINGRILEHNAEVGYDVPSTGTVYGFQENNFRGIRGKRKFSNIGNDYSVVLSPSKQPAKRPSALSRLQSGISVWNRIQEKPSFLSSSPPVVSPPKNSKKHRAEVSTSNFKSNNLVGERLTSPSPALLNSDGKDPPELTLKKRVKKKLVKKLKEAAAGVVYGSLTSVVKDCPKIIISDTKQKVSNGSGVSGKQVISLTKVANDDAIPQNSPMKATGALLTNKKVKKNISNRAACGEDGELTGTKTTEKSLSKDPSTNVILFESGGGGDDHKEQNFVKLGEDNEKKCVSSLAELGDVKDAMSSRFDQANPQVSLASGTEQLAFTTFPADNTSIAEVHVNSDLCRLVDGRNSEYLDMGFVPSRECSSSPLRNNKQFLISIDTINSTSNYDSTIGNNLTRKRQSDGNQQLDINMMAVEFNETGNAKSRIDDACLNLEMQYLSVDLPADTIGKDLIRERHSDGNLQLTVDMAGKELKEIGDGRSATADVLHLEMQTLSSNLAPQLADIVSVRYPPKISRDDRDLNSHALVESPQSDCLISCEENLTASPIAMSKFHHALPCTNPEQSHPGLHISYDFSDDGDKKDKKTSTSGNSLLALNESFVPEVDDVKAADDVGYKLMSQKDKKPLSHENMKQKELDAKVTTAEENLDQKIFMSHGPPKVIPRQSNFVGSLKKSTHSHHNVRNKTWHREDAPTSSSQGVLQSQKYGSLGKQYPKKPGKLQISYVRKGNSLIRKPSSELPHQPLHTLGTSSKLSQDTTEKNMNFLSNGRSSNILGCHNPSFERPKTPPLIYGATSLNCSATPLEVSHSLSENSLTQTRTNVDSRNLDLDALVVNGQNVTRNKISETFSMKKMIYVKHKSNQLVAALGPKSNDSASSDLYYKKKKNQLIRSIYSSDGQNKHEMLRAGNTSSSKQVTTDSTSTFIRKRLNKAKLKQYKHSMLSHVWTLTGKETHKSVSSLPCLSLVPYLFPWKRPTYWTYNSSILKRHSLLLRSQKSQLARKKDVGQKDGVPIAGRSSLKWTRSLQRRSKVVNKEAALAIAEVARKKREEKNFASVCDQKDEQLSATSEEVRKNSMTSLAPRKLLGGNNQYIRIGNGNQLVRDPKKIIRILANEKVRWSLHNIRLRLARKNQYCQFFTRYGKCNRKGGKCPYIHDPSKVAICTKFLSGLCSDANCKLTHKIIPERMPDCSYFLQGLCTNKICPYRHVNVNINASVCEGFLKGYCADGDECRKKHSYVCPLYNATGVCLQGSKCKLHHPKRKKNCKGRKAPTMQSSNSWGRYFCSSISKVYEPSAVSLAKDDSKKVEDTLCYGGRFADYISLSPDNIDVESNFIASEDFHYGNFDLDNSTEQKEDLDALIKPILIMRKGYSVPTFADS